MVGDEAAALRRALEISYPVENGVVRVRANPLGVGVMCWAKSRKRYTQARATSLTQTAQPRTYAHALVMYAAGGASVLGSPCRLADPLRGPCVGARLCRRHALRRE